MLLLQSAGICYVFQSFQPDNITFAATTPKMINTIDSQVLYCQHLAPTKAMSIDFGPEAQNSW